MSCLCPNYNSPASLKEFMASHNMAMQKKFSQNFLLNENARKRIIDTLEVYKGVNVWEIGPGLGAMTGEILKRGANLTAFEIDRGFIPCLEDFFSDFISKGAFRVVQGDVLRTWNSCYQKSERHERLFGNLPYSIASTFIGDTIERGARFDRAVFTVQKEVAQRMCAKVCSNCYSSFSVMCQWAYNVKSVFTLSGGNFWPRAAVDSTVVLMTKKREFPRCRNPALFVKLQHSLFVSRRKTVKNNLAMYCGNADDADSILKRATIDGQERAENLTLESLLYLSDIADSVMQPKE